MALFRFQLKPTLGDLPRCSTVLNGVARHYRAERYRTTLSLKSVTRGAALYETPQARHLVTEDSLLIVNHDQEYSLRFEGLATTETFCPFFQPGFVESVAASLTTSTERQLDDIEPRPCAADFCERLYPNSGRIARILRRLRDGFCSPAACDDWLEDGFYDLAAALVALQMRVAEDMERFPGLRVATREELYRRLHRARDVLSSCYADPLTVADAARAAHLSPFHFHRLFRAAFGRTPMSFLQEQRLAAACRLLRTTEAPVTSICFAVGFESLGSFGTLFHKMFHVSPRQFRLQARGRKTAR
jgi:AraC-like DNA-binding protein